MAFLACWAFIPNIYVWAFSFWMRRQLLWLARTTVQKPVFRLTALINRTSLSRLKMPLVVELRSGLLAMVARRQAAQNNKCRVLRRLRKLGPMFVFAVVRRSMQLTLRISGTCVLGRSSKGCTIRRRCSCVIFTCSRSRLQLKFLLLIVWSEVAILLRVQRLTGNQVCIWSCPAVLLSRGIGYTGLRRPTSRERRLRSLRLE